MLSCPVICRHAFVMLSASRDLISQDYYELFPRCDNEDVQLRWKVATNILQQIYNQNTSISYIIVVWYLHGHILLQTSDGDKTI